MDWKLFQVTLLLFGLLFGAVKSQDVQAGPGMNIGGMDAGTLLTLLPMLLKDVPFMQFFNLTKANVSSACGDATSIWMKSIINPTPENMWALEMLDASGKLPSGFLRGGFPIFGSFDQCLDIKADPSSWSSTSGMPKYNRPIQGKYCSVKLLPEDPGSENQKQNVSKTAGNPGLVFIKGITIALLRLDVCLPDACTMEDINTAYKHHFVSKKIGFTPVVTTCQTKEPTKLEGCQMAAIVILSILGVLLVCGTVLDLGLELCDYCSSIAIKENVQGLRGVQVFLAFSVYRNALKLLDTRQSPDSLTAVNGIRFLSMTWVILGHCYSFLNVSILGSLMTILEVMKSFEIQAVINGTLSVDSFFFLSGLLLSYLTIKELRKGVRLNLRFFIMFYFHRFWRLTPAVILVILSIFVWPLMFSGPLWEEQTKMSYDNCKENWWLNVLYVQNFFNLPKMCLGHSWFLANDMQFYVLSPIILIALYMNRYVGLAVNGTFLLASLVTSGILAHYKHYIPTILVGGNTPIEETNKFMTDVYIKPWCRIGPFCIGIFVGYFLALKRNYKIPWLLKAAFWCVAIACNMSVLYATYPWNKGDLPYRWVGDFYMTVHRTVWAIGLGWLTFACANGDGGVVNRILSWKPFVFLGRLTYLAYLIHPFVQYTFTGMLRDRLIYTHYLYVTLFLGFLAISYGLAFPLSLAFEAPFLALEKVIFPRPGQKNQPIAFKSGPEKEVPIAINGGEVIGQDNLGYSHEAKLTEL